MLYPRQLKQGCFIPDSFSKDALSQTVLARMLYPRQFQQGCFILDSFSQDPLSQVQREQGGEYRCHASNVEGDGHSEPIQLNVMCEYRNTYYILKCRWDKSLKLLKTFFCFEHNKYVKIPTFQKLYFIFLFWHFALSQADQFHPQKKKSHSFRLYKIL